MCAVVNQVVQLVVITTAEAVEHLPLLTVRMVTVEKDLRHQVFKEAEVRVLGSAQVVLIQVLQVVMVLQLFIIRRHNYGCM